MQVRINKLIKLMEEYDFQGVALNPGSTMTYLTGLDFHLMERPTVLLITREGKKALVLPTLEIGKLEGLPIKIEAFHYGDDPETRPEAFFRAAEYINLGGADLGVEATRMRYLELMYLGDAFPESGFLDASTCLAELRVTKDTEEQGKMRRAAEIAQKALMETLRGIKAGVTEKEVANQLIIQLLRAGSDPGLPFSPIVAFGENTANPHSAPSERPLKPGDLLLVDWGASYQGYLSDITRTFTFGDVDPELIKIGEIVMHANQAGRAAGRSGVEAGAVDRVARAVIEEAGYGEAFIHRTGHGLGMEAHEEPYIFDSNSRTLDVGMTFTVEPGIYLPGKGGVRIEDDVVVTETGLETLTDLPREVLPLESLIN